MAKRSARRTSLASLAEELGVSRTTVSNAYNHPEQLSEDLRVRILDTAERLGYPGPDPAARSLRMKRVGSIGVLVTEHLAYAFEDMASVDFLAGLAEACIGFQTTLTLVPVGPTATNPSAALQLVNSAVVDGFVVYSVAKNDPYLEATHTRGLPTVVCDQPIDDNRFPFVGIDEGGAIAPAAQALVDAGHRRIGILCLRLCITDNDGLVTPERVEDAQHHVQRARVQGALHVFANAGIATHAIPIIERHTNTPEATYAAARELLTNYPDITAILCTADTMALSAMQYAHDHDMSIPKDLSITGFDGIREARMRGIATVVQPNRAKGEYAGHTLMHMIDGEYYDDKTTLDVAFHPGTTIGPPRCH